MSRADKLSAPAAPRRLLVRGVNWLGDAVMTTPALHRLREHFPQTHITLLTPVKLAALWMAHPALDQVLSPATGEGTWALARRLREQRFDTGLVLPNSPRSALELWLARIPRRVGYARPWRNWWLTESVPPRPGRITMRKRSVAEVRRLVSSRGASDPSPNRPVSHQINEYLHLAGILGADTTPAPSRLALSESEAKATYAKFGLGPFLEKGTTILGLNPGAEYGPAKRWPAERFIAAAAELQRRTGCLWLIFGGVPDKGLADGMQTALQNAAGRNASGPESWCRNLAGETSLRELMGLLKCCRALLTNDTGPMHVAAALGTPVVVPFGSTSAELTGPGLGLGLAHQVLQGSAPCAPCFRRVCPVDFRCMSSIEPERAVAAILKVLG